MTTTEQATFRYAQPDAWTKNRILRMLVLHRSTMIVPVDAAAMICQQIVADYEKRIDAIEMAASQATNDMVAELMTLRAELAALKAGDMTGHLEDDDD